MTRLYLIRHAEAEGNLYRRMQGWYNSLITDKGLRQIKALEARFASEHIDAVYSSDLFRTMRTARAIYAPHGLPLNPRADLREVNMGVWEDRPWGEVAITDPEQLTLFNQPSAAFQVQGGETYQDVRVRVSRALSEIAAAHPGQTVAVVAHGMAIRCALSTFLNLTVEEMATLGHSDNTAVSLVELEGDTAHVVYKNDASHLTESLSTFAGQKWWKHDGGFLEDANLWYRPLDMERETEFYYRAREEAWHSIHGSMRLFDGDAFLRDARAHAKHSPDAVSCAMIGDRIAGLLQLDICRGTEEGVGMIPFFYMLPEYRKMGLGVQLLGQAVSVYRPLGRKYLRLRCAPDNLVAQRFYQRYGFQKIGVAPGARVPLDLMEKYIGYDDV